MKTNGIYRDSSVHMDRLTRSIYDLKSSSHDCDSCAFLKTVELRGLSKRDSTRTSSFVSRSRSVINLGVG